MLVVSSDGTISVGVDRTVAMLALTAIHDIMKVRSRSPPISSDLPPSSLRAPSELPPSSLRAP